MSKVSNLPTEAKLRTVIERVLKRRLGDYGYAGARISPEVDIDEEPSLVVDVQYDAVDKPIDSAATFGLITELRRELAEIGETRFPYVRHHFDENRKVVG